MSTRRMLWILLGCLGLAGLFFASRPGPAWALDLGAFKVTPSVAYQGEYDDNLFRTQFNKRSDYINHIIPAIKLEFTPGKHEISAGASADILRYSRFTNQNTERYFAGFNSIFRFNRLELRGIENFKHTDDFPSSELTTRIKRNENYLGGGGDFDVARLWGVGFDFEWGNIYYLDHDFDFLSENKYTYAANVYYRLTGKTRLFMEYDFVQEWFGFDATRNDNRHRALIGARGDFTDYFSITAKGGYERINFLNSVNSDFNTFMMYLEANYRPIDRLQIFLVLSQDPVPASFTGNPTYTPFISTFGLTYALTPKITIIPHGSFGLDRYRTAVLNPENNTSQKRFDYIYGGGLGIRYEPVKWLKLEANYDYTGRNSNFNNFDYDDNRVFFTVTLSI